MNETINNVKIITFKLLKRLKLKSANQAAITKKGKNIYIIPTIIKITVLFCKIEKHFR